MRPIERKNLYIAFFTSLFMYAFTLQSYAAITSTSKDPIIRTARSTGHVSTAIIPYSSDITAGAGKRYVTFDPYEYPRLCQYGRGPIVVLLGTSTSGKSTLIKQFTTRNPHFLDYTLDHCVYGSLAKQINRLFPEEVKLLEKIATSSDMISLIRGSKSRHPAELVESIQRINTWIETSSEPEKDDFSWNDSCMEALQKSRAGNSVILDLPSIDGLQPLFRLGFCSPIQVYLIFCPLTVLAERMVERNRKAMETGDLIEVRENFPLWQYTEVYKPRASPHERVLETITRAQACDIFDRHLGSDAPLEDVDQEKRIFLSRLGFRIGVNAVEITSRFQAYTGIIDTSSTKM